MLPTLNRSASRHINRAVANDRNDLILLDIVRASRNVRLNFVAFLRVSGSRTAQASAGLIGNPHPVARASGAQLSA